MVAIGIGDLAQHYSLQTYTFALKTGLRDRLKELGTEEVADVSDHLSGRFGNFAGIERSLEMNQSHAMVLSSTQGFLEAQYRAFEKATADVSQLGLDLLDAATSADPKQRAPVLSAGSIAFEGTISALNSQAGGRALFAGAAVHSAAFLPASEFLTALTSALSDFTTASDIMEEAEQWFAPGGAYDSIAYLGSDRPSGGFKVSPGETIVSDLTGNVTEVRDLLKAQAVAASLATGHLSLSQDEEALLMKYLGEDLINLNARLISRTAALGAQIARVVTYMVSNDAERFALSGARRDLIGISTEDTVVKLSAYETQLEIMYNVTARLSRLSLAGYL